MTQNKYTIYIKGWGEYEDSWYPHNKGDNIIKLKEDTFADWDMEAEFYIEDTSGVVHEEGIINKGIYS